MFVVKALALTNILLTNWRGFNFGVASAAVKALALTNILVTVEKDLIL